jgi:hypothetical protein
MIEQKYLLMGDGAVAKIEATKKEMDLVIKTTNATIISKTEYEKHLKRINKSQKHL